MADGPKYVVHGMRAKCSEGSMENYINTDKGHGVVYQGQPVLNANDHAKDINLTHFGDCKSKLVFEEAKKQADEKYKAEEGDGFFAKLGKGIAKTVTKAVISVKETFASNKCELDTPLPWIFTSRDHMIDGAPALTMESQCACKFGGIITIVPQEEEAAEEESSSEVVEVDENAVPLAATADIVAIGQAVALAAAAAVLEGKKDKESQASENPGNKGYGNSTKELIKQLEGTPFLKPRINDNGTITIGYGYDFTEKEDPEMFNKYLVKDKKGNIKVKAEMTSEEADETIIKAANKKGITKGLGDFINGKGFGNTAKPLNINQNQYDALFSYFYASGQSVFSDAKYDEWISYGGEHELRAEARKELKDYLISNNGNYDSKQIVKLFVNSKGANIKYDYKERRTIEANLFNKE